MRNTDKTPNKVHFERRGPAETVVLWLECTFQRTCVFFQAAIKVEKPSLQMLFYVVIVRYMTGVSLCQHRCCSLLDSLEYDRDDKPLLIKHSIVESLYKVYYRYQQR